MGRVGRNKPEGDDDRPLAPFVLDLLCKRLPYSRLCDLVTDRRNER